MKSYDVFRDRTRRLRATKDLNEFYREKCQRLEEENGRLIYMLFGDEIPLAHDTVTVCNEIQIDTRLGVPMTCIALRFKKILREYDAPGQSRYRCELLLPRGTALTKLQAAIIHNMIAQNLRLVTGEGGSK